MTSKTRKLIGTFGLLALAVVWSMFAMALAQSVLATVDFWGAWIFYVVVGLGWVLPAMPLVKWMVRLDRPGPTTPR
jgi:hypothetical protein